MTTRRLVLTRSAALVGAASTGLLLPQIARAQGDKVRVGLMLPYTGTFAQLGVAIENGVRMAINEKGGKLGGREIEWFKVDDESEPSKGVENANRLVQRDKVDVLIGTVHSGVQMGIQKVARDSGVLNLIPNAGVHAATRALCAPNVFRTSFTNSQPTLALGKAMVDKGHKQGRVDHLEVRGRRRGLRGLQGKLHQGGRHHRQGAGPALPQRGVPGAAHRDRLAAARCGGLFLCRRRRGQVHPRLRGRGPEGPIPLYGSGFLTEGVLDAAGPAADGIITTMHYSDSLDTPRNKQFRLAYATTFRSQPDVYAVQGYDTGQLLVQGAAAVKGDLNNKQALYKATVWVESHGRQYRRPA